MAGDHLSVKQLDADGDCAIWLFQGDRVAHPISRGKVPVGSAPPCPDGRGLVIAQVSQIHPELMDRDAIDRATWAWDTYRWCGGAFAFTGRVVSRIHQHVIQPEGRIYFAGEHCSHSHSWMQGALESAESAVDALLARAG
jgi:monoamine oxidase